MLFLRTFGGLSLESSGLPIVGAAAQRGRLAILAVLAVGGDAVSRDRLLSLFWPESDSERARGALKQALYALRRDVAEPELTVGTSELGLNPEIITSDVRDFERALATGNLAAAVTSYSGPFLDGIYIKDAPEFEQWVERERKRLAHAFRDALERLATDAHARENYQGAIRWWRQLAAADPLSARVARAYMEALAAAGDREAAIRHGRVHAEMTREELGAEPDSGVLELVERLRANGGANGDSGSHTQPHAPRGDDGIAHQRDEPPAPESLSPRPHPHDESLGHVAVPVARRPRFGLYARIAAGVLIVGAGGAAFAAGRQLAPGRPLVLAIVSLRSAPGDSALERLQRLVSGSMAQEIVQTRRMAVVDLQREPAPGGRAPSVSEDIALARQAGADRVLRGEVYRKGDSAFVRLQVLNTKDGHVVEQLDPVAAPLAQSDDLIRLLRDAAAGAVAALADTTYRAWTAAGARPPNYSAFSEFKLGLEAVVHRVGPPPESPARAIQHFRNAVRLDTAFIQAKVWLLDRADRDPMLRAFADSVQAALLAGRARAGPYDQASIDNVVAIRSPSWEDAYHAAHRMTTIAPTLQDAHAALARAAMATRRYSEAIKILHDLAGMTGWMSEVAELWQWDLQAHHFTGDYEGALSHWRNLQAARPADDGYCRWAIPDLVALNREAAVDSLVAECIRIAAISAPLIPDRMYFDNVLPEYVARGNLAAARRVAARIRPEFEKYAPTLPPKAHDLAYIDCMLGEWATCYARLRASVDTVNHNFLDIRRLAVAAAHVGDTTTVNAILRYFERNEDTEHRGWTTLFRAMIVAASGDQATANGLLTQAMREGVAPCGCEWMIFPNYSGRWPEWYSNWYSMWELQPLRGVTSFEVLLREHK